MKPNGVFPPKSNLKSKLTPHIIIQVKVEDDDE